MRSAVGALHHHGGGGGYTGPLDIVPGAVVAYGQRALSAAKRGTALYTIREDAGNTAQSFNSNATTGAVDAAAIAVFINGANGFLSLLTDQSGNANHAVQAVSANQPGWTTSVIGSQPGFVFAGASQQFLDTESPVDFTAGACTAFVVLDYTNNTGAVVGANFNQSVDCDAIGIFAGTATASCKILDPDCLTANGGGFNSIDIGATALMDMAWDNSQQVAFINGTSLSLQSAYGTLTLGPNRVLRIGSDDAGSDFFTGTIVELLFYNTALSAPNCTLIRQNIASYYGITLL